MHSLHQKQGVMISLQPSQLFPRMGSYGIFSVVAFVVIAIIMYTWIRPTALRDPARETSAFQAKQPAAQAAGRQAGAA